MTDGSDACCHGVVHDGLDGKLLERCVDHRGGEGVARAGGVDHVLAGLELAAQHAPFLVHVQAPFGAEADEDAVQALVQNRLAGVIQAQLVFDFLPGENFQLHAVGLDSVELADVGRKLSGVGGGDGVCVHVRSALADIEQAADCLFRQAGVAGHELRAADQALLGA